MRQHMLNQFFFFSPRRIGCCAVCLLVNFSAVAAEIKSIPNVAPQPAQKSLSVAPLGQKPAVATPPSMIPTPVALEPEIVADGGGVQIGSTSVAFNTTTAINSTVTAPSPRPDRPNELCRFTGTFHLRNVGGGAASGFDVYTWLEQQSSGKIDNTGYYIPGLNAGGKYAQNFSFDLRPGTYTFWLSIDPYHKIKQATAQTKQYRAVIKTSCGVAGTVQVIAPAY